MDHFVSVIVPIIIAIFASTGFWEFLSNRKGSVVSLIEGLKKEIDNLREDHLRDKAERARSRILRFDDELRMNWKHSKEYFDDILRDISAYNHYCAKHPDFENEKAVRAIKHVCVTYDKCHEDNDFL